MCDCLWELDLVTDKLYFEISKVVSCYTGMGLLDADTHTILFKQLYRVVQFTAPVAKYLFLNLLLLFVPIPPTDYAPPPPHITHTHTHHTNTPWRKSSEIIILYPVICIQSGQQFTCLQSLAFLPCWSFYSKIVLGVAFAKKVYVKWKQN